MASGRSSIASRKLLAIDEKGQEIEVTISVGEPYEISETEWACPASLEGLQGRFPDIHGGDSWQALQLAHEIIGWGKADLTPLTALTALFTVELGGRPYRFTAHAES